MTDGRAAYRPPIDAGELIAYLRASRGWVRYQAPLDLLAPLVKVCSQIRTWKRDASRFQFRVDPCSRHADKFTADAAHLDRFRIPIEWSRSLP